MVESICHVFVESKTITHMSHLLSGWKMEMYVIILEINVTVSELHYQNLVRLASQTASAFQMYFNSR